MDVRRLPLLLLLVAAAAAASGAGWPRRGNAPTSGAARQAKLVAIERYSWSEDPPRVVSDGADSVDLLVTVSCSPRIEEGAKVVLKITSVTEGAQMEYFPWDGVSEAELQPGGAVNVKFKITTSLYNTHSGRVRFKVKLIDVQRREGGDYKSILDEVSVLEELGEIVTADGEKTKTLVVRPKK